MVPLAGRVLGNGCEDALGQVERLLGLVEAEEEAGAIAVDVRTPRWHNGHPHDLVAFRGRHEPVIGGQGLLAAAGAAVDRPSRGDALEITTLLQAFDGHRVDPHAR